MNKLFRVQYYYTPVNLKQKRVLDWANIEAETSEVAAEIVEKGDYSFGKNFKVLLIPEEITGFGSR